LLPVALERKEQINEERFLVLSDRRIVGSFGLGRGLLDVRPPGSMGLARYFQVGMPALCVMSALMGYLSPDHPWPWGAVPLGAQTLWMVATQGLGNLWPLGLIVSGIFAVPPIMAARFGAFIHRRTHQAG
jgi:hypothetical protein